MAEKSKVRVLKFAEHVLKRPDMYIGGIEPTEQCVPLFSLAADGKKMVATAADPVVATPALARLVNEITTNAVDQSYRAPDVVRRIDVSFSAEDGGEIKVRNDGGIPVSFNAELDMYDPEVIFAVPMSGTNFDDTEEREVGGRNGYGAKIANAAAQQFAVTTCDTEQLFAKQWQSNMQSETPAKIKPKKLKKGYTEVAFLPDYAWLGLAPDDPFVERTVKALAVGMCAVTKPTVTVTYNGAKLPVKSFKQYVEMFGAKPAVVTGERLEVAVLPVGDRRLPKVHGFVNSLPCDDGTHVAMAQRAICAAIAKKTRDRVKPTPSALGKAFVLFVRVQVDKPTFGDQAKTKLTTRMRDAGIEVPPFTKGFVDKLAEGIVLLEGNQDAAEASRAERDLKSTGQPRVPGYVSADTAGRKGSDATLILPEGKSAAGFVVDGLGSTLGYGEFGYLSLRGKIKNVWGHPKIAVLVAEKEVLRNLVQVIGAPNATETGPRKLRYNHVAMLADQDYDGGHICLLNIVFLAMVYPDKLRSDPAFVRRIATPVIKATRGGGGEVKEFMTERAFDAWWAAVDDRKPWKVKYYKGLGTSTPREAKQVFGNLDRYMVDVDCTAPEDLALLDLCFSGKDECADKRKELIAETVRSPESHEIDYSTGSITLGELIRGELIPFFRYNVRRNIPRLEDGMVPARRKVLWVLLNGSHGELKVNQLSADVSLKSGYMHGEDNLNGVEVNLAADHPLAAMLSLLVPQGNFGNRHEPKAAGSPRYIFTRLEKVARALFRKEDNPVLKHQVAEGMEIEPECLMPVVPLVLINGTSGVGSGWSTDVPSHAVADIVAACRELCAARMADLVIDWQRPPRLQSYPVAGRRDGKRWVFDPVIEHDDREVRIVDVPKYTSQVFAETKADAVFFAAHPYTMKTASTDLRVDATLTFRSEESAAAAAARLADKATLMIKADNMHLLTRDSPAVPVRFETVADIIAEFGKRRIETYEARKAHQIAEARAKAVDLRRTAVFVQEVLADPDAILRSPRETAEAQLRGRPELADVESFDRYFRMTISRLTLDEEQRLAAEVAEVEARCAELEAADVWQMWLDDLDRFEAAHAEFVDERKRRRDVPSAAAGAKQRGGKRRKANK